MDEQALNELLECSVCLDQLNHTSKVLPCQHTFCRRCLHEIVSTKHELRCPECRFLVETPVDELPTNILLIRLLEGIKTRSVPAHKRRRESGSPSKRADPSALTVAYVRQHHRQQGNGGSSRPCAKALFNYDAKDLGDLTFKKGDLVYLCKQVDENWYHGELPGGQHGFFPASYVKVKVPLTSPTPQCKALYDFSMEENKEGDCLSFRKDEMLTVLRKVDDNWLEGRKGDKIGIFPTSFVELNEAAKKFLRGNGNNCVAASKSATTSPVPQASRDDTLLKEAAAATDLALAAHPTLIHNKRHSFTSVSPSPPSPARLYQRRSLEITSDMDMSASGGHTPKTVASPLTIRQTEVTHTSTAVSNLLTQTTDSPGLSRTKPSDVGQNLSDASVDSKPISIDTVAESRRPAVDLVPASKVPQPAHSDGLPVGVNVADSLPSSSRVYVALYNYKPQKDDEVALTKGDYYSVSEKCQDGWFKGVCLKSGDSGVFPGNYVQSLRTHSSAFKPVAKTKGQSRSPPQRSRPSSSPKSRVDQLSSPATYSASSANMPSSVPVPPRPKTSPGRASSADRDIAPPPVVPRSTKAASPLHSTTPVLGAIASVPSKSPIVTQSSSKPHSPVLSSSRPSSQHSRPHKSSHTHTTPHGTKSGSRNSSPMSQASGSKHVPVASAGATSVASPVWKHSLSASANITPPNMVVGAGMKGVASGSGGTNTANTGTSVVSSGRDKDKEKKKDKERPSLMKRLTAAGKSKKPKGHSSDGESSAPGEAGISHNRSGSYPGETQLATLGEASDHKKTSSLDSSTTPPVPVKPARPKPLMRERFRCVESYPAQGELELELKIGDVIYVHKKRDDGWYKGTLQRSGKTGLFPGSFVEKFDRGEP